ncbi:MAG: hypothetical protein WDO16_21025 [Bacteroidota bacterium]
MKEQKQKAETALVSPDIYADKNRFMQAEAEHKNLGTELAKLEKEYEQVFEKIMELESGK